MNHTKEIERHRIPCGAATIALDGVCRKKIGSTHTALLDRLTQEIHPEGVAQEIIGMNEKVQVEEPSDLEKTSKKEKPEEGEEEKKGRLIAEGMLKADVKKAVKEYEEQLMGNSKMLQDPSGKLPKK